MDIWGPIKKAINSNLEKPLNELMTELINPLPKKIVKSVQSGITPSTTYKSGTESLYGRVGNPYTNYIDITISEVADINKCQLKIDTFANNLNGNEGTVLYIGKLVNTTTLRVYYYTTTSANNTVPNSYMFRWEITEFAQ